MDDAARRRAARASWPIRRVALADEGNDVITGASPSELVAMVHALTLDAWAMSGRPIPSYRRGEAPGHVVRRPR